MELDAVVGVVGVAHPHQDASLVETAYTDDEAGILMGVRHADRPHYGVQFHPESILTDAGKQLVRNFTAIASG